MPRPATDGPRSLPTAVELQVLVATAGGPVHGQGIREAVRVQSEGALDLGPGTLYEAIHRLLRRGWLREVSAEAVLGEAVDARKRYYVIAPAGRAAMEEELGRLDRLLRLARARDLAPLGGGGR